jgi:hypothetical protein
MVFNRELFVVSFKCTKQREQLLRLLWLVYLRPVFSSHQSLFRRGGWHYMEGIA